jgi:hypothetical protein
MALVRLALFPVSHKLSAMNARELAFLLMVNSIFAYLQMKVLISKRSCVLVEAI